MPRNPSSKKPSVKQAGTEIRTAELEAIFETMEAGVIVYDAEGRIVRTNTAARTYFHLDAIARFTEQPLEVRASFTHPRDAHGAPFPHDLLPSARILQGATLRGADAIEVLARLPDGQNAHILATGAPLRDAQGAITGAVVTYRDVTEQRRMESQLRFQASMLERTHDAIVVWQVGGPIIFWNRGAELLYGYPEAEAVGQPSHTLLRTVHPEGSPQAFEARLLQEGEWSGELVHTARDGHTVEVLSRHQVLREPDGHAYILETSRDITKRKRLERDLAERVTLLQTTFDTMAEGLTTFDAQGRLLSMNHAYQRLILSVAEQANPDFLSLTMEERNRILQARYMDGRPIPTHEWAAARVLRGELTPTGAPMDVVLTTLTGREVTLSVSGGPIMDEVGQTVGGVSVFRDVTEQRRLERDREELLSLVAHDLANALTSVKLRTQRLQRLAARAQALSADDFEVVAQVIGGMERLISDLRVSENLEVGHFTLMRQPCDLAALCREVAGAAQASTARVVNLILTDATVVATVDRDRIGQVLANLLSNALKYSFPDRPVDLTLITEEAPGSPMADGEHELQRVARIIVRDWGLGIAPEALPHLFERYYRAPGVEGQPGRYQGLGLGLYIARELVERHGGEIGVSSIVGEGSTFWFTLPLAPTGE